MKKEILFPVICIPIVVFGIIGTLSYLKVIVGIWSMLIWIIGFLISSVGVTYLVAKEQIRTLNEKDEKNDDK